MLFTLGSIYSTNASGAEQMLETNNSNWAQRVLRTPTGRRQTSWLFTSMVEDLNWDYREQIQLMFRTGLELGPPSSALTTGGHAASTGSYP